MIAKLVLCFRNRDDAVVADLICSEDVEAARCLQAVWASGFDGRVELTFPNASFETTYADITAISIEAVTA